MGSNLPGMHCTRASPSPSPLALCFSLTPAEPKGPPPQALGITTDASRPHPAIQHASSVIRHNFAPLGVEFIPRKILSLNDCLKLFK